MARHVLKTKDYTSSNGMFHLSAACREGGDGQCDGFTAALYGAGHECDCECHSGRGTWAIIRDVAEMEAAHARKNRISLTPVREFPAHRKG